MNRDMEELIRAASYLTAGGGSAPAPDNAVDTGLQANDGPRVLNVTLASEETISNRQPAEVLRTTIAPVIGNGPAFDAASLAIEANRLMEITRAAADTNVTRSRSSGTAATPKDESSVGEQLLRTAGMMTGVGPIVMGLMKLFGSDGAEPLPVLEKFQLPGPVSVEAGLGANRQITDVRYAQGGTPEVGRETPSSSIQVNIQAMDSQSFLDRQEDIARAVREAMLHSNSLNDVVLEL